MPKKYFKIGCTVIIVTLIGLFLIIIKIPIL